MRLALVFFASGTFAIKEECIELESPVGTLPEDATQISDYQALLAADPSAKIDSLTLCTDVNDRLTSV